MTITILVPYFGIKKARSSLARYMYIFCNWFNFVHWFIEPYNLPNFDCISTITDQNRACSCIITKFEYQTKMKNAIVVCYL